MASARIRRWMTPIFSVMAHADLAARGNSGHAGRLLMLFFSLRKLQ
jgi:hypothetical protein